MPNDALVWIRSKDDSTTGRVPGTSGTRAMSDVNELEETRAAAAKVKTKVQLRQVEGLRRMA